jgi:hypothetical protein
MTETAVSLHRDKSQAHVERIKAIDPKGDSEKCCSDLFLCLGHPRGDVHADPFWVRTFSSPKWKYLYCFL